MRCYARQFISLSQSCSLEGLNLSRAATVQSVWFLSSTRPSCLPSLSTVCFETQTDLDGLK